jgi:hypothetical protein
VSTPALATFEELRRGCTTYGVLRTATAGEPATVDARWLPELDAAGRRMDELEARIDARVAAMLPKDRIVEL